MDFEAPRSRQSPDDAAPPAAYCRQAIRSFRPIRVDAQVRVRSLTNRAAADACRAGRVGCPTRWGREAAAMLTLWQAAMQC